MAPSRRVQERRDRVAEWYVKGYSMRRVAAIIGVSLGTIASDVDAIRNKWRDNAWRSYGEWLADQLAVLAQAERSLWDVFERSMAEHRVTTAKTVTTGQGDGERRDEASDRRETRDGAVAAIMGIVRIVELRCRMLGIRDAPKLLPPRRDPGDAPNDGDADGGELTVAEVRENPVIVLQMIIAAGGLEAFQALEEGDAEDEENEGAIDV